MAITNYKSGAQIVLKYGDVSADFPTNGKAIADTTTIGIICTGGTTATYAFTMDSEEAIAGGTAVWFTATNIAADGQVLLITEYGATGVKITGSGAGVTAWIKS